MPRIGTVIRDVYRRPGTEALPAHLAQRYGIQVAAVTRLDAGVFRVDRRDGPPWVARAHLTSRPLDRAVADAEVLAFLQQRHFPAERPAHAEPVSELAGRAVLVTEFVPGGSWAGTAAAWRALGDYLGRLHALPAGDGLPRRPAGSLHHLPDFEGAAGQDVAAASALLADLDGRVPPERKRAHDTLLALLPNADDCAGLPEALVHPDPAHVNVISTTAGPVLVDWTGAGTGARLASVAVLLQSAGPAHAAEVLQGYGEHQQLTPEELDRLVGVLWIRPLWLAAWQLWLSVVSARFPGGPRMPDASRIEALAASVRAALAA